MTAILTFGIAVYKGDLLDRLEAPLFKSLNMYQDNPTGSDADIKKKEAFKEVWNVIQTDVSCLFLSFRKILWSLKGFHFLLV